MSRVGATAKEIDTRTELRLRELDRRVSASSDDAARAQAARAAQGVLGFNTRVGGSISTFVGGTRRAVISTNAQVRAGRMYIVSARAGLWVDGAGDSGADMVLTLTTDGDEPTTTDAVLKANALPLRAFGSVLEGEIDKLYYPTSDHTLSVLFSVSGWDGARTYGVYSVTTWRPELWITDLGVNRGETGAEY